MTWARTDDGMLDHPKWVRAVRLGGSAAVHLWLAALHWCSRHLTDGDIPVDMLDAIGGPRGFKVRARAFRALAEASLILQRNDGGITLVNYCEFNPTRAKVLEDRGRRAKAQQSYADRKKLTNQQPITVTNQQTVTDNVPARPGPARIEDPPIGSPAPVPVAKPKRAKPRTPVPDRLEPNDATLECQRETGFSVESQWPQFKDYHLREATLSADWQASMRTWLRKQAEWKREKPSKPSNAGASGHVYLPEKIRIL